MDQFITALPWLVASIIVLAAIVFGMGFALHFQTRMPKLALPLIGALMTFIPPIGIVLVGRNLSLKNLDYYQTVDPGGIGAWLLRGSTAGMIALALAIILKHEGGYVNHPRDPGGTTASPTAWSGRTGGGAGSGCPPGRRIRENPGSPAASARSHL